MKALSHGQVEAKTRRRQSGVDLSALRHAIIEQALPPGAKLPEDAIGERFGASRTIVRMRWAAWPPKGWWSCAAIAAPRSRRRPGRRRAISSMSGWASSGW